MRHGLVVLLAAAAASTLSGAAPAGSYFPPPGDALPTWSPDGFRVAFETTRGGRSLAVVPSGGGSETRLLDTEANAFVLSPDWQWVALTRSEAGGEQLSVRRVDDPGERQLAVLAFGRRPAWSPDSRRIAFVAADGRLAVVHVDDGNLTSLAGGGFDPAWSPDGTRLAFVGGLPRPLDIYVVNAEGGDARLLAGGSGAQLEPRWSPDGTRIAFLTQAVYGAPTRLAVVRPDGTGLETYPGARLSNSQSYVWMPNSREIVYAGDGSQGLFLLDLTTGSARRLTRFGGTPAVSPDGRRLAFAMGGECRDRDGIYTAHRDGTRVARLTNDCHLVGTPRDDVIRGTELADVIVGLAGHDRLFARDSGYVGDTLLGGEGDDVLVGHYSSDLLRGGRGSDRLLGGPNGDVLEGGPGRDKLVGQAGRDLVYARDGERDVVSCGTNRRGTPERDEVRDEVWADRLDRVARDFEIVHRRG